MHIVIQQQQHQQETKTTFTKPTWDIRRLMACALMARFGLSGNTLADYRQIAP